MKNWKADSMVPDHLDEDMYSINLRNDKTDDQCAVWGTTPEKTIALAEKVIDAINNYEYEFENDSALGGLVKPVHNNEKSKTD